MTSEFTSVTGVEVRWSSFNKLVVVVTQRVARSAWCNADLICYDVDENGFIFERSAVGTPPERTYTGGVDGSPIGSVIAGEQFARVQSLVGRIELIIKRKITSVRIDGSDVYATLEGGGEIRFLATADESTLYSSITTVFSEKSFRDRTAFEYADFRFQNKALVK